MQETTLALPERPSVHRAGQVALGWIRRFGFYAGGIFYAGVLIIAYFVHMHLVPDKWKIVPSEQLPALAFVIALMFILSELVKEYKEETNKTTKALRSRVTSLNDDVKNLVTTLAPQLPLLECVDRLQRALHRIPPGEELTINHLGLDMESAWLHVREKLLDAERRAWRIKIHYRMLMITGDFSQMAVSSDLQKEMEQMCHRASVKLEEIKTYLTTAASSLNHVDLEIKTYGCLPVIHGLSADKPTPVHYVSLCGWRGLTYTNYDWGEGHYYEIHGRPAPGSSNRDMMDLFEGYFQHLWRLGPTVYRRR